MPTTMPGLGLLRHRRPTSIEASVYEPVMCLILQGRKETRSGSLRVDFGAGESLVVTHHLPVVSQVTLAPYLALLLTIDRNVLLSLSHEVDNAVEHKGPVTSLSVARIEPSLVDALARYVALLRKPQDAQALGPLILREIHYRLLTAPHGALLRRLLSEESNASHIARAIDIIRKDYGAELRIPALARAIGMSGSAFHRQFRAVTGTTPLQYQKEMRLLEARRLITSTGCSVSHAALEVGYVSPSQFSREYRRKFGVPPGRKMGAFG
ncbi:MAG: AraC family transcriptional regulator N-terminal domain-containing protein [Gemmataceae bacterium]